MKLLVVEDDRTTADYVARGLREAGHTVDLARDGHEALMLADNGGYDVLVLDRMIPKLDGLRLLRVLREGGTHTPALFLTAMGGLEDRIEGLNAGGDDYLIKPFSFAELLARVTALARRPPIATPDVRLQVGEIVLERLTRTVTRGEQPVVLLPTEYRLLEFLMRHPQQVVTRTMLLEHVWEFHFDPKTNIVETHISRLRAKLDRGFDYEAIRTVRGAGYQLVAGPDHVA